MRFIRHGGDFAYPIGDAGRVNGLHRPQAGPGSGRRSLRHSRCDCPAGRSRRAARTGDPDRRRALLEGFANRHGAGAGWLARPPEAKGERRPLADHTGRAVANPSAASAVKSGACPARRAADERPRQSEDARGARGAIPPRRGDGRKRRGRRARSLSRRARASRRRTVFGSALVEFKAASPIRRGVKA